MSAKHLTRVFVVSSMLSSAWLVGCGSADPAFVLHTDNTTRFANNGRSSPADADATAVDPRGNQDALPELEAGDGDADGALNPGNSANDPLGSDGLIVGSTSQGGESNTQDDPGVGGLFDDPEVGGIQDQPMSDPGSVTESPNTDGPVVVHNPDPVVEPQPNPLPEPQPEPVTTPAPAPAPAPTPAPVPDPGPIVVDPVQACSQRGTSQFDLSVARHQDVEAGLRDRYHSTYPISDAAASEVVRITLDDIAGNVLPVTTFGLDDIAIIVKESVSVENLVDWDELTKTRDIYIPEHALLVFNGNDPNYASGSVDSGATTNYHFYDHTVVLPGGQSHSLRNVYEMGVPLIAHNQVGLAELRDRGFVNDLGEVVFKVIHVSHGHGFVQLQFTLNPCQE
jgi:hypothetical protein